MGQGLYAPPSVAGWDGGPAWINSTTMLARTNFVLALLSAERRAPAASGSTRRPWPSRHGFEDRRRASRGSSSTCWSRTPSTARSAPRSRPRPARRPDVAASAREAATLVLTSPEYQLA